MEIRVIIHLPISDSDFKDFKELYKKNTQYSISLCYIEYIIFIYLSNTTIVLTAGIVLKKNIMKQKVQVQQVKQQVQQVKQQVNNHFVLIG